MARTDTLTNYLTDVASAIKTKKGDNTPIQASSFDTEIANLPSGGDVSEYFVTEIQENQNSSNCFSNKYVKKTPPFTVSNNVTALSYCFTGCVAKIIDVSQMNMSNITNTNSMFSYAHATEIIGLNNWNVNNVRNFKSMFESSQLKTLDCSSFGFGDFISINCNGMFKNTYYIAILDISNMELNKTTNFGNMFSRCGESCLQSDGAYANGIPYVYVKDTTQQNLVLTQDNGHPGNWSTDNVIVKSN